MTEVHFSYLATGCFFLAVLHTLLSSFPFHVGKSLIDYALQKRNDNNALARWSYFWGVLLRLGGEVEIIFGLWLTVLLVLLAMQSGWDKALEKLELKKEYPEALFVTLLMIISSTQPVLNTFKKLIGLFVQKGKESVGRWWFWILTLGPLCGSFITEAAAMTLSALLLDRKFFCLNPKPALAYGTIGLLFFNVSIGGTLTNFAAPPVVLVAHKWQWGSLYLLIHFGIVFVLGMVLSNLAYYYFFKKEFQRLELERETLKAESEETVVFIPKEETPLWIVGLNFAFLMVAVGIREHFVLMLGELVFFLAFVEATKDYQGEVPWLKACLVGFFLASLQIFGNLQSWWLNRFLNSLSYVALYLSSIFLSSLNDNALISSMATVIVPELDEPKKRAIIAGALSGGGLTIIANAPNLAGLSLLRDFFPDGLSSTKLFKMAFLPTVLVSILFLGKELFLK